MKSGLVVIMLIALAGGFISARSGADGERACCASCCKLARQSIARPAEKLCCAMQCERPQVPGSASAKMAATLKEGAKISWSCSRREAWAGPIRSAWPAHFDCCDSSRLYLKTHALLI
jgi:hypothetical protein